MTDYYTACEELRERSMRGGWISVKERLPEYGRDVLTVRQGGQMEVRCLVQCEGLRDGHITYLDAWYPGGSSVGWVTHWQPLPKAPEGA